MNHTKGATFSCRLCQNYQAEGRRGGTCKMLNVPVQSNWLACSLAIPYFSQKQCSREKKRDRSDMSVTVDKILPLKAYNLPENPSRRKVS